jgi:hypothetical protein
MRLSVAAGGELSEQISAQSLGTLLGDPRPGRAQEFRKGVRVRAALERARKKRLEPWRSRIAGECRADGGLIHPAAQVRKEGFPRRRENPQRMITMRQRSRKVACPRGGIRAFSTAAESLGIEQTR